MDAVSGNKSFTINEWHVDPALNRLSRADEVIKIDPQNMKVLELLASRPGDVISQCEIEQFAWSGVIVTPNSVYQTIAQLPQAWRSRKGIGWLPRFRMARRPKRCPGKQCSAGSLCLQPIPCLEHPPDDRETGDHKHQGHAEADTYGDI